MRSLSGRWPHNRKRNVLSCSTFSTAIDQETVATMDFTRRTSFKVCPFDRKGQYYRFLRFTRCGLHLHLHRLIVVSTPSCRKNAPICSLFFVVFFLVAIGGPYSQKSSIHNRSEPRFIADGESESFTPLQQQQQEIIYLAIISTVDQQVVKNIRSSFSLATQRLGTHTSVSHLAA